MSRLTLFAACAAISLAGVAQERPNILLIVADDLGYADLGAYGGDIDTPNIDALAEEGILFTQFHTAPVCAVTRSMLLTGNNNHVAGMGKQYGAHDAHIDLEGYEGHLSDRVVPLPELLRDAGYHTYSAGKWHLGQAAEHSAQAAGFERHFNLSDGSAAHFHSMGMVESGSQYREDGQPATYPDGRYSTDVYTEKLIEYIESNRGDGRPFFVYAAYTSPHWPLQVPDAYLDLYRGRYDAGYEVLREQRLESLKRAGIIPADSTLPPRDERITPWESLSVEQQRIESRKMELYAAMVDNLDDHVGQLIDYLRANDLYDNTLIVFMSDNGAAGEDFYRAGPYAEFIQSHYDNRYENMGKPNSWISYGPPWAEAGSAPFSRYKSYTREGGITAPLIVAGRAVDRRGVKNDAYLSVMDLAPTFLELAGAEYPQRPGLRPMLGASLVDVLAGNTHTAHDDAYTSLLYHNGRAYLRQGRWKLVNLEGPFAESRFELFDLETDPGETKNLAASDPERYARMLGVWRSERRRLGILLPEEQ